VKNDYQTKKL